MAATETSYTTRRNFLDMEEGVTGQHHLKAWQQQAFRLQFMRLEHRRVQRGVIVCARCLGGSEVSHGAHVKSFSLFYRRVYIVLGSLGEHCCSRITRTG